MELPGYRRKTRLEYLAVAVITATAVFCTADASLESHHSRIGFDKYHNYDEMTDYLTKITDEFPDISSLYSIGNSVLSMYDVPIYIIYQRQIFHKRILCYRTFLRILEHLRKSSFRNSRYLFNKK